MIRLLRNRWRTVGAVGILGLFLFYVGTSLVIGHQVRNLVGAARVTTPGEPIPALLSILNSPTATVADRDHAIWALGQLGAAQALDDLEALYTGQECQHDTKLCQDGLAKAIELCRGEQNIGALVWRHGILASNP